MIAQEFPVNASIQTKDLFSQPKKIIEEDKSIKQMSVVSEINRTMVENGGIDAIDQFEINRLTSFIDLRLEKGGKFDTETQVAIKLLLLMTLSKDERVLTSARSKLFDLIKLISKNKKQSRLWPSKTGSDKVNEENLNWFYDQVISNFTESQIKKIIETHGLDSNMDIENPTKEQKKELLEKLINLSTNNIKILDSKYSVRFISKNDSPSYFGLDNCGKEAICWQQLEMSRSKNIDYGRLAATIAWKTWLFKKPLLKDYCLKNNIKHESLNFSEKARLTREAVLSYSEKEIATILDSSIEAELEKRKSLLKVEENQKFINKRVSMGIELEIGEPPFETALIYAWYENLDREQYDDSIAYSEKIEEMFKNLSALRDKESELQGINKKLSVSDQLLNDFTSDEDSKKENLLNRVNNLIDEIESEEIKMNLKNWLQTNEVNKEFLEVIKSYWESKYKRTQLEVRKANLIFYSFLDKERTQDYQPQRTASNKSLPIRASNETYILLDLFSHHMGKIQAIGHSVGTDAYGEYNLAYTSANFREPYRVNIRQNWELAEAGFHDLEIKSRPIHASIGWDEDREKRKFHLKTESLRRKASVINFALMTTGWTNMQVIIDIKNNNEAIKKDGMITVVSEHRDTGRSKMVRERPDGEPNCYAVEFRGLSPRKNEHGRLFPALGNLGTIMKANLVAESDSEYSTDIADDVDKKLSEIWIRFETKVTDIYNQFTSIAPLYDANAWANERSSNSVKNFYLKVVEDYDKSDGVVAQMRSLILETNKEIDTVFAE